MLDLEKQLRIKVAEFEELKEINWRSTWRNPVILSDLQTCQSEIQLLKRAIAFAKTTPIKFC